MDVRPGMPVENLLANEAVVGASPEVIENLSRWRTKTAESGRTYWWRLGADGQVEISLEQPTDNVEVSCSKGADQTSVTGAPVPGGLPQEPASDKDETPLHSESFLPADEEDSPGEYVIKGAGARVNDGPKLTNRQVAQLPPGSRVQVVELLELRADERLRAQILDPPGWISLMDMADGFRFATRAGPLREPDTPDEFQQANKLGVLKPFAPNALAVTDTATGYGPAFQQQASSIGGAPIALEWSPPARKYEAPLAAPAQEYLEEDGAEVMMAERAWSWLGASGELAGRSLSWLNTEQAQSKPPPAPARQPAPAPAQQPAPAPAQQPAPAPTQQPAPPQQPSPPQQPQDPKQQEPASLLSEARGEPASLSAEARGEPAGATAERPLVGEQPDRDGDRAEEGRDEPGCAEAELDFPEEECEAKVFEAAAPQATSGAGWFCGTTRLVPACAGPAPDALEQEKKIRNKMDEKYAVRKVKKQSPPAEIRGLSQTERRIVDTISSMTAGNHLVGQQTDDRLVHLVKVAQQAKRETVAPASAAPTQAEQPSLQPNEAEAPLFIEVAHAATPEPYADYPASRNASRDTSAHPSPVESGQPSPAVTGLATPSNISAQLEADNQRLREQVGRQDAELRQRAERLDALETRLAEVERQQNEAPPKWSLSWMWGSTSEEGAGSRAARLSRAALADMRARAQRLRQEVASLPPAQRLRAMTSQRALAPSRSFAFPRSASRDVSRSSAQAADKAQSPTFGWQLGSTPQPRAGPRSSNGATSASGALAAENNQLRELRSQLADLLSRLPPEQQEDV